MTIDELQAILSDAKAGKIVQVYTYQAWVPKPYPEFLNYIEGGLRIAPEPREIWLPDVKDGYATKEECQTMWPRHKAVLFRQVMEDEE